MQRLLSIQHSLRPVLTPLGAVYAGLMALRRRCYERGLLASWSPPAPTVAVGNIGWGGTGKTPLAGWLLFWAEERGLSAALLTRGYRARPKSHPYHVQPGALAEEAGDEPLLLARQHPRAAVVVDPLRSRGGRFACERFNPSLIVLDDGFQHLAVERDMNLVLLRAEDLADQWDRVLPAGSWREGRSALSRADAFLLKVGPKTFRALEPLLRERLEPLGKPVFSFSLTPVGLRALSGGAQPEPVEGGYLLVSGVGNPAQVERTAAALLGKHPARHLVFPDHHLFTKRDVTRIQMEAGSLGCSRVICTPKDAVKLGPMADETFSSLDLRLSFGPSLFTPARFDEWFGRRWETLEVRRTERLARAAQSAKPGRRGAGGGEHGA
ncbi:tetraacyldisaccharide 4'-kinase [Desulfovibrio sp.]